MKENEINVLDELNKGACMGVDAINYTLPKVTDKNLYNLLEKQSRDYKTIIDRIGRLYPEYSNKEPHETSMMNKAMTWYGIQMKTLTDHTTSKIAELIMQGTNMGIIEGRRLLNHKDTDKDTKKIVEEYVNMQEKLVEELKKCL